jgi:leucyl aminopeptidase (aminopeptidase T)
LLTIFLSQVFLYPQPTGKELEMLAEKLVTTCVDIKEGESVLIIGSVRDLELLENIAVEVRKVGAFPMISIGSDRISLRSFTEVPPKYDSQRPELELKLADIFNAIIQVEIGDYSGLLADIPAERIAKRTKAYEEVNNLYRNRKVRSVYLGNGLYPIEELANRFKISKNNLTNIFWNGVNVDFNEIKTTGEVVKEILKNGKQIHVTTPAGTDLTVNIEGRPIGISDGIVTKDEIEDGNLDVWLPAGEIYMPVNPGIGNGTLILKKHFYEGKAIEDLTITFQSGKVTSITAKSGLDRMKSRYDAAGEGKDKLAYVDFGINPNVTIPEGSEMITWVSSGMVSVGIGGNLWAGGENSVGYAHNFFIADATVTVDGKVIIENGDLKIK